MIWTSGFVLILITIDPVISLPFLQNLFSSSVPTSNPATHISDYRKRPRSDSRADKSDDSFQFDENNEPMDVYMEILGNIVDTTKDQFEQIAAQVKERQQLNKNENIEVAEKMPFDENANSDETELLLKPSEEKELQKKHFSSLFTGIGLSKLQRTNDPGFIGKVLSTSSSHLKDSLIDTWRMLTEENSKSSSDIPSSENNQRKLTEVSNKRTERAKLAFRNAFDKYSNAIRVVLPTESVSSVPMTDEYDNETRMPVASGMYTSDALGNVNTANGTVDSYVNLPIERIDEYNKSQSSKNSIVSRNANMSTANISMYTDGDDKLRAFLDNDNDDDNRNDNNDDTVDDEDDDGNANEIRIDAESTAIFVLEIIGTIVGLTWGAFSQLQSLFVRN